MKTTKTKRTRVHKVKKPTPFLKVIFAILIIASIGYYTISRLPKDVSQLAGINEVGGATATTTLSLPTSIQVTPGTETTLDLMINAGSSSVAAVQVELDYDPTKMNTPAIIQGDFLTDKLGNPSVSGGKISFVFTTPIGSTGKTGTGKLATIKFKPTGDSQIKFTNKTMVAAIGSDINVLLSATGTTIQTTTNPAPVAPPILEDIIIVPTPAPQADIPRDQVSTPPSTTPTTTPAPQTPSRQATPKQTIAPANPTAAIDPTKEANDRIFDETGNFDYSNSRDINNIEPYSETESVVLEATEIDSSPITRFLTWIKTIFGGTTNVTE